MKSDKIKGTQSFSRSMDVLQIISDHREALSVNAILNLTDLTRPTLYRILSSLEIEGVVSKTENKHYRLGARLINLAYNALAQVDIRQTAYKALTELRDETSETVHLAIQNRDEMIYVEKIESREVVRMTSIVGTRVPFYSSSVGKAYLAALNENEAKKIIENIQLSSLTNKTLTDTDKINEIIKLTRKNGYSFDNEENEEGIVCFGAAILGGSGLPVASVSVSVPTFRLKKDKSYYWQPLVLKCAQISKELGFI
jgi:DNA-binding IclR family transcriptional regulator